MNRYGYHKWRIVPLCNDQLRDINSDDVVSDGDFRICNTYKGGGGYDLFPQIAYQRGYVNHPDNANKQFVVQLYGCNLDCPYCYVTREGVWGDFKTYYTKDLAREFSGVKRKYGVNVFHLMGGAPALQLKFWPELLDHLGGELFHSDLMLTEGNYDSDLLKSLNEYNVLLAVNIKGLSSEEWKRNTRKSWDFSLFYHNLEKVVWHLDWSKWYFTFTNVDKKAQIDFMKGYQGQDYFSIGLIDYEAMPYVDNRRWGA